MKYFFLLIFSLSFLSAAEYPGRKIKWNGFDMYVDGANKIVVPNKAADGKPWVWRARFFGHEPQFDIAMLNKGYHVVYCHVGGLYGSPQAVKKWNDYYNFLRLELLLADKAVLEGFSRGGLIIYNWAAENPDKVAAIYGDAPVMDFKSWPGVNSKIMKVYGFKSKKEAGDYKKNPIDNLAPLAKAGIPIIHVVGDADKVVPVAENTAVAEKRYKKLGGTFKVIHKDGIGHHPHSLKDPGPIVDFIVKHCEDAKKKNPADIVSLDNFEFKSDFTNSRIEFERNKKGHVAFIGGSITKMEGYRPLVCEMLKKRFPKTKFTFTNAGISSTCSNTGAFRLNRDVLSKGPVDLLFIEFAVNDDQDAAHSRENCIRGMEGIIVQVRKHNPSVDIIVTHFVNKSIIAKIQSGEDPVSVKAHSDVAAHHGVSVNNFAKEVASLLKQNKMSWKQYGGVHPSKFGNIMCTAIIEKALSEKWKAELPADAKKIKDLDSRPLLDSNSYSRGRLLPNSEIKLSSDWILSVPEWKNNGGGNVRERFRDLKMIHTEKAGAKLKFKFTGSAIGMYMLAGRDSALISCRIDGGKPIEIDTLHHYSGFNYPRTVILFDDLKNTEHTLELEVLENRKGRIKKGAQP